MAIITSYKDKDELEKHAADIISRSINRLLEHQRTVVLGVPGGRSVSGIFRRFKEKNIPWKKVHVFMVDERLVPLNHPDSNFKLAKEHFIDELTRRGCLLPENVHPFVMAEGQPDFGISDYEEKLIERGGIYDLVLLSSGEDGHVAGLYPHHHSINDDSQFYLVYHDSPKLPKDRMTISRKLLLQSKSAVLLFVGETKKGAYAKFEDKSIDYHSCPAKLVLSIKDSYVLTDFK